MNDVAQLQIEVDSRQVRSSTSDLERLERQGAKTENRFKSFGKTAQSIGRQLNTWVTLPILGAGAMAIKTAADYETLRTQLEVLVGSAEVARDVFSDLTEFAATTPFEIDGIVRANNLLLGFGVGIEQTQSLLRTLGDIAAVSGGDLFSMARVTGEARAEGKLLTRDLRQLIAQGVPIIQLLAESLDVAENQIFELATAGEIGFQQLVDAFEMATAEGGLFFEGMEKRSATLAGIFSNFADSVNISLASVGDTLIETLDIKETMRELVADIEMATKWFNSLDSSTQRMIVTFGLLLAAAGPVIGILGALSLAIGAISTPVLAVTAAVALGTAAIINNWGEVERYFTSGGGAKMWTDLQGIVENTAGIIIGIWDEVGNEVVQITEAGFGTAVEFIGSSLENINKLMSKFNGEFDDELNIFEDNILTTLDKIDSILTNWVTTGAFRLLDVMLIRPLETLGLLESETERVARRMAEKLERLRNIGLDEPIDVIIEPTIDIGTFVDDFGSIIRPESKITIPADELIEIDWAALERDIFAGFNPDFGQLLALPGSIRDINNEIARLQEEMQLLATDPEGVREYQNRIEGLQAQIRELTGETEQMNDVARDLGFTFSSAFEDAMAGGNSFRDVLDGIFQDMLRISTQTLITKPLGNELAGFLSGFIGSPTPTNDLIITDKGQVFQPHEDDTIFALKNLSGVSGERPSGSKVYVNVVNTATGAEVSTQGQVRPNGDVDLRIFVENIMKDAHNSGRMGKTMGQYGVRRQPVMRG